MKNTTTKLNARLFAVTFMFELRVYSHSSYLDSCDQMVLYKSNDKSEAQGVMLVLIKSTDRKSSPNSLLLPEKV